VAEPLRGLLMTGQLHLEPADSGIVSAAGCRPEPGDHVRIKRAGADVRSGVVELVSADYQKVWLKAEGVNLRQLFDISEGYEFAPSPPAALVGG